MAQQEGSTERSNKSISFQNKKDIRKAMPSSFQSKGNADNSMTQGQDGNPLEQLSAFLKDNWKTVLAEMVSAGVTAYLAYGAKDKAAKN